MNRRISECSMAECAGSLVQLEPLDTVLCKAMWLHLAVLGGLYYLLRWYRERQVVSHLPDKFVFITGCDSGFGNLLAQQLDLRGLRVLAACLMEQGAEQLRNQTSDRLQTVILDVTKTESIAAASEWVKEHVGNRDTIQIYLCLFIYWEDPQGVLIFKALILPRNWCSCFKARLLMCSAGLLSKFSHLGFSTVSFPTSLQKVIIHSFWGFFASLFSFISFFSSLVSPSFLFLTIPLSQSVSLL